MSSTPARPARAVTARAGVREEEGGTLVLEKAEPVLRFKRDFEAGHPERIQPRCNHGLLLPGLSGNPLSAVRDMTACVAPGSALSGVSRRPNQRRHQREIVVEAADTLSESLNRVQGKIRAFFSLRRVLLQQL